MRPRVAVAADGERAPKSLSVYEYDIVLLIEAHAAGGARPPSAAGLHAAGPGA